MHKRSDQSVQSAQIVAHLKQVDVQREISIWYKNTTQKEGQRFGFFSFVLSFLVLIYHESIYLKQTGPMSKPNSCSAPPMSKGAMSRMGRRDGLFVLYSITVLLHSPVCLCRCEKPKKLSVYGGGKYFLSSTMTSEVQQTREGATHSAAILQHREGKAAVALSPQLHVVGALEHHSLLHVASLTIHVCNAVLAVVGDVLASLVGQQAHEGQLGGHALWAECLIVVGELHRHRGIIRVRRRSQESVTILLWSGREGAHLGATVDSLSEPDVLLALGASEPVLLGDALGVGIDAGLTGGEVAEDLDGVVDAALVGVDPVESYKERQRKKKNPSK